MCIIVKCIVRQGHVFAMEISSGEEFYIACDNTGTPLAVFSNNGLLLKQVCVYVILLGKGRKHFRVFVFVQILLMKLSPCQILNLCLCVCACVCRCSTRHMARFTLIPIQTLCW